MASSKKCLASIYDAPISSFLYSVAFGLIFLSNYVLGHHDIPHLSDNLAAAAENLEPALKNGKNVNAILEKSISSAIIHDHFDKMLKSLSKQT